MLAVPAEDGTLATAVPVFEKRRGPFVASALPPLCPAHMPLLAGPLHSALVHSRAAPLDVLLASLAGRYAQATLQLGPALPDVRPLTWAGWAVRPLFTYTVDLSGGPEAVARAFSSGIRRDARTHAGAFEIAEGADLIEDGLALVHASLQRQNAVSPASPASARRLVDAFSAAGLVRVAGARRDGRAEAVAFLATDGATAAYWMGGSAPGPAMTVLLATMLPRLARDGLRSIDLCGANLPSVAEFKRRFGATLAPAPRATVVTSRALRWIGRFRG